MDEATKQALLSAIRSLLIVVGSSLAAHGVIASGAVNEIVGAVMVIIPIAWGIYNKFNAERKTQVREVLAVQAGVAVAATGTVGETVRPVDVPAIIKEFSPAVQPTEEASK